ncbi:MAG TPA: hypothetical protein PKO25_03725 [Spirochaetota bacterium]|nr:hypothetical protein [Spirochaetota bacterium]OPZ37052.1 MAG: hypothetical protein BWY96_01874 [Spirochaetes bacterium ADurb.BinA120]HNU90960.1 hypothetical protein [Spirochaetota bacterium]HPI13298.1 hypothetical protein [Spirochaetota bacterium]HPO44867.1 hypothetical protein [Spirochaetota bacterium]
MKHLATTAELKEGLVLRAYRSGFGYARLVVAGVTPYFYVTEAPDDFYRCVEAGETLSGYLWTQNSVSFEFGMSVAGKISVPPGGSDSSAGDRRFLAIAHTVDITSSPERRCLKASVSLPFRFFKISLAKSERSFYTEEIDHLDGVITMLSDREAVLETDHDLAPEALIRGRLSFDENHVDITARVLSAERGRIMRYDIEYTGLGERERNRILEYVFSIYRE